MGERVRIGRKNRRSEVEVLLPAPVPTLVAQEQVGGGVCMSWVAMVTESGLWIPLKKLLKHSVSKSFLLTSFILRSFSPSVSHSGVSTAGSGWAAAPSPVRPTSRRGGAQEETREE